MTETPSRTRSTARATLVATVLLALGATRVARTRASERAPAEPAYRYFNEGDRKSVV